MAIRTHIGSTICCAQSMISHSASQGVYRRLDQRECLRAPSSGSVTHRKRRGKGGLMHINVQSENWGITEENIALQGVFEITTSSRAAEIQQAIGNATREKYSHFQ